MGSTVPVVKKLLTGMREAAWDMDERKDYWLNFMYNPVAAIGKPKAWIVTNSSRLPDPITLLEKLKKTEDDLVVFEERTLMIIFQMTFALSHPDGKRDEALIWEYKKAWSRVKRDILRARLTMDYEDLKISNMFKKVMMEEEGIREDDLQDLRSQPWREMQENFDNERLTKYGALWPAFLKEMDSKQPYPAAGVLVDLEKFRPRNSAVSARSGGRLKGKARKAEKEAKTMQAKEQETRKDETPSMNVARMVL